MTRKPLRIGLVGYGFMGRTHSNAFARVNQFFDVPYRPVLQAVCGRDAGKVAAFAEQWGYGSTETGWRKLVARPDIDLIDIASPNDTHGEIAIAAAEAGKMVLCEKPLGRNAAESERMVEAVKKAGVPNMVWYNYRRVPAVTLAKQLIDEGRLGKIFHYRAKFLQDWPISADLPQGGAGLWRLDVSVAGSGVTGDLLAHCIDTAMWLNGAIDQVTAMTETFVKERPHALTGRVEKVGIDDASAFLARFQNGSLATFEATSAVHCHGRAGGLFPAPRPAGTSPSAKLRGSGLPSLVDRRGQLRLPARNRPQSAAALQRPRIAGRRSGPGQDHRSLPGAEGVLGARHGAQGPGAGPAFAGQPMERRADREVRLRASLARRRGIPARSGALLEKRAAGRRIHRHGPPGAARHRAGPHALGHGDRRRSALSEEPRQRQLEAGGLARKAIHPDAHGHPRREQSDRAV